MSGLGIENNQMGANFLDTAGGACIIGGAFADSLGLHFELSELG